MFFISFTAILAAILFPVFAKAREKARQASCAANLKQISIQMLGYSQDYDDKFPPADHWMDSLEPYRSDSGETVYHCPAIRGQSTETYGYAYNRNVATKPTNKIADPRIKMLAYDSSTLTRSASDPGTSRPEEGRHSNGNNVAFADGHVKWFRVGNESGSSADGSAPADGKPIVTP
jgi:prepilin-type processing-associated H-X9-DG protein